MVKDQRIEYMCSWCGRRIIRSTKYGKPDPGTCPRRPKGSTGKGMPHRWVKNRVVL